MTLFATLGLVLVSIFGLSSKGVAYVPGSPLLASAGAASSVGRSSERGQGSPVQTAIHGRPSSANRLFKTRVAGFRLWASPATWIPVRTGATEKYDVALDHVAANLQAVVITQSGAAPMSTLADIALRNARKSDPNSTITAVEKRVVGGHELMCVTYESQVEAGAMTFYGYLYSEDQGTVEVIAMAPRDLFQVHRAELTELLNGLEILPPDTPLTEALPGPQAATPEDMVDINPLVVRQSRKPAATGLPQGVSSSPVPAKQADGTVASSVPNSLSPGTVVPGSGSGTAVSFGSRPVPLNKPRPNYTEDARRNRVEGFIRVRALVGADGGVKDVRLLHHLPDGLDEEAILAAKQMRFKPAMKDYEPVAMWVTLEVEFNMCDHCVPAKSR